MTLQNSNNGKSGDWKDTARDLFAVGVAPAPFLTIANLLLLGLRGRVLPVAATVAVYIGIVAFLLFLRDRIPFLNTFVKTIVNWVLDPLIASPWLLVTGNITNRRLLRDIHRNAIALQESALFARLAELSNGSIRYYHILHSHKGTHPAIGNLADYKIAGFPVDEAQITMRLWYLVTSALNLDLTEVRPVCSCVYRRPKDYATICAGPYAVVGSPKENEACKELMGWLEAADLSHRLHRDGRFLMRLDPSLHCNISEDGKDKHKPDLINPCAPPPPKQVLKDYALLMKLPQWSVSTAANKRHTVMLFAGCKVGGQCGLTEWFFSPANLANLATKYSSKYFQILLEVTYNYVREGYPRIVATNVKWEEELRFESL